MPPPRPEHRSNDEAMTAPNSAASAQTRTRGRVMACREHSNITVPPIIVVIYTTDVVGTKSAHAECASRVSVDAVRAVRIAACLRRGA